ncbi:MAG: glutathione S-transferase family protein [Gammaproteobacteria bacterium]|nr:glutathione S-transferase family protein [Gammaproteobacteria bacterium]MDH5654154.1 glutathione S-transferase family protein [Gammaproteobacteria bacterium]
MLKLHGMSASGNCHKVRMLLSHLQIPYIWQEVDVVNGETRTEPFLAMNPVGQVPTLEIEPGKYLAESNAILIYLAEGSPFIPVDNYLRAQMLGWMFYEQYSHEPYVAVARFICKFLPVDHLRRNELPRLHERGNSALAVMQQHLASRTFFVGEQYSLADIALYAYTHCAEEGGFTLQNYPAVTTWLQRIEEQPGFVPMTV